MKQLNHIQNKVLHKLLFSPKLRYSEIKPEDMTGSHFKFYLDQLLVEKLVTKREARYILTRKGKELANQMNTDTKQISQMPKVTSKLCCIRGNGVSRELLIYKRLKNPFYGHIGIPTHKVWYGEPMLQAVKEGLTNECGLSGEPELVGIRRYLVYFEKELVEDKLFFIHRFSQLKGEISKNRDGEYFWCKLNQVEKVANPPLPEFAEILGVLLKGDKEFYKEINLNTDIF